MNETEPKKHKRIQCWCCFCLHQIRTVDIFIFGRKKKNWRKRSCSSNLNRWRRNRNKNNLNSQLERKLRKKCEHEEFPSIWNEFRRFGCVHVKGNSISRISKRWAHTVEDNTLNRLPPNRNNSRIVLKPNTTLCSQLFMFIVCFLALQKIAKTFASLVGALDWSQTLEKHLLCPNFPIGYFGSRLKIFSFVFVSLWKKHPNIDGRERESFLNCTVQAKKNNSHRSWYFVSFYWMATTINTVHGYRIRIRHT